jgi:hypothetical protein
MTSTRAAPARNKRHAPWKGRARAAAPKTCFVRVRYDPTGRARLDAKASAAHMTLSDYIRHITEGPGGARPKRKPPVEAMLLGRALAELGHWGGNLNQLSKAANISGALPTLVMLGEIIAVLKANRRDLLKALGHRDH